MKFNDLDISANKKTRRVGRGISAGKGKTAGRGTKGQNSRAGSGARPGFEGGQNPFMQKIPKLRGFTSHRPKVTTITTTQLNKIGLKKIDNVVLFEQNLVDSAHEFVKLVYKDPINSKMSVSLQGASQNAINSIQNKGGDFTSVGRIARLAKKSQKEV